MESSGLKSTIKDAVFLFLRLANPTMQNGSSILMYHSVGTNRAFFTVSPYQFERQLNYLVEHDYQVLRLSEVVQRLYDGEDLGKSVCLTFDDGYRDNYEEAFSLLKKYNLPATIFVVTNLLGKSMTNSEDITLPLMSKGQMEEMQASGLIDFMPHTHNHLVLDQISHEKACDEVVKSQMFLEDTFDNPADLFAFPKGVHTKKIITFLRSRGFRAAVGVEEGLVHMADNPFLLKRNSVDSSTSFIQFKGKISIIDFYQKMKRHEKKP